MKSLLKRYEIIIFFVLVIVLSWFPWYAGIAPETATFMPSLLALIMAFAIGGRKEGMTLLRSMGRWRAKSYLWLIAIFGPLVLFAIGLGVHLLLGGQAPPFIMIKEELRLLPLYLVIVLLPIYGPVGEEFGWRGYILPKMQNKYGPLIASLVIGTVWGIWHLPDFFADQGVIADLGFGFFLPYILGTIANAIYMTWLYNKSKASALIAGIVWHAATDFWAPVLLSDGSLVAAQEGTSLPGIDPALYAVVLAVLGVGAIVLTIATKGSLGYSAEVEQDQ